MTNFSVLMYRITAKTITFSQVIFFEQPLRTKKAPHRSSSVLYYFLIKKRGRCARKTMLTLSIKNLATLSLK